MMNRLFFALELPAKDKAAISHWRELSFGMFAKPVPMENLHLTLCFLGDVSQHQEQQLIILTDQIQAQVINMDFSDIGVFSKPGVLYMAPCGDFSPATKLAAILNKFALQLSIKVEKRAFKPHITLFRKVKSLPGVEQPPLFSIQFRNLVLYRSTRGPNSVIYRDVASWALL